MAQANTPTRWSGIRSGNVTDGFLWSQKIVSEPSFGHAI